MEGTAEAQGLDEAIAWAKEKFQSHSSLEDWSMKQHEKVLSAEVAGTVVYCLTTELIFTCKKFYKRLLTITIYFL